MLLSYKTGFLKGIIAVAGTLVFKGSIFVPFAHRETDKAILTHLDALGDLLALIHTFALFLSHRLTPSLLLFLLFYMLL